MLSHPGRSIVLTQIVFIFILPILLLYFGVISQEAKFFLLAASSLIIYSIVRVEKWTHHDLGLRTDNIKSGWPYYAASSLLLIVALLMFDHYFVTSNTLTLRTIIQRLVFFIPMSVFQEFAFSVFLLQRLAILLNKKSLVILASALVFSFMHIIYDVPPLVIVFSFFGSMLSSMVYLYKPNFLLVCIAHSAVNITAVMLGFFI
ncbi:MAG TPA: CPBP family glutamic-type intramembrane protease [Candidatus Paceibacterota bacterium]